MKQFSFLIGCLVLCSIHLNAQSQTQKDTKSVQFGTRLTYETQVNISDYDFKANLPYVGVFSDIRLNDK